MIILTVAESTPIHEAERLQTDLRRAGIEPYGWLVNSTLTGTNTQHPILRARALAEYPSLQRIEPLSDARTWSVAWQTKPPIGSTALRSLIADRPGAFAGTGH